jgi:serine/threonine protein kinase
LPAATQLEAGASLDEFEILERIGYGAFSDVYRARHPDGRVVVLKCPHEVMLGDAGTFDRFRRELRIGQRLQHPGIQRCIDEQGSRSRPYMILEYVPGQTLRQLLRGKPLTVDRAVDLACQLTDALAYAHAQGVVHRDIKPENILVEPGGRLAVTDFGIALMEGARRITYRWFSAEMGTPDYMAPEQIQGKRGDARTDIYAIGVVLFEMLSGRVPWGGDEALSVMSQKLTGRPAELTRVAPRVPAQLGLVVAKCLRRDPAERYGSGADLLSDLRNWQHLDGADFNFAPEKAMKGRSEAALWWLIAGISGGFAAFSAAAVGIYYLLARLHG